DSLFMNSRPFSMERPLVEEDPFPDRRGFTECLRRAGCCETDNHQVSTMAQKALAEEEARADAAFEQDKEAAKNIALLNERKKEKEEDLNNLRQGFEAVEKQPGQAGEILKELKGGG
ncbi:MAG: hypothetical protein L3J03_10860, partial [Desulfobacterales bacterium]|nr:hypothetical protein [Desulfobacterales bacterium]